MLIFFGKFLSSIGCACLNFSICFLILHLRKHHNANRNLLKFAFGVGLLFAACSVEYLANALQTSWQPGLAILSGIVSLTVGVSVLTRTKRIQAGVSRFIIASANAEAMDAVIKTSPHGFAFVSVEPLGYFIEVNDRLCEMFGMRRKDLLGCSFQELTHPDDLALDMTVVNDLLAGRIRNYRLEKRYTRGGKVEDCKAGDFWWGDLSVALLTNGPDGRPRFLAQIVDIDQHKRAAMLDALCSIKGRNVYSRKHIMLQIELAISARSRSDNACLIVFDLDGFKSVNDSYDHLAGDRLLQAVCERTLRVIGPGDLLARPGGDEFWILMPGSTEKQGFDVAQRVLQEIRRPYENIIPGKTIDHISASIGVADLAELSVDQSYPSPVQGLSSEAEAFIRQADTAAILAKRTGKNRVLAAKPGADSFWRTIREIEEGLKKNEFVLWYQPIVNAKTYMVEKHEALVRWNHPRQGLIGPDNFIPLLEENKTIHEMCRRTIALAAERQNELNATGIQRRIQVNVNPITLEQDNFMEEIAAPILGNGAGIEITETIQLSGAAEAMLKAIKAKGTPVSLDDLGAGDRGLKYILDANCLKLDRLNLIEDVCDSTQPICRAIINLAHSFTPRATVVAEGVETPDQLNTLKRLGCDYIQGFLFAKPMPWADAEAWSTEHNRRLKESSEYYDSFSVAEKT